MVLTSAHNLCFRAKIRTNIKNQLKIVIFTAVENCSKLHRCVSAMNRRRSNYENMLMNYTAIFHGCKNDNFQMKNCDFFLSFAQNIDCWYTLEPPQDRLLVHVRTASVSTHNLCFRAKIRQNEYPCKPQFY